MTNILLVDDDRAALSTMANALTSADYVVERALTLEQARMKFFEQRPDLVVLEVMLGQNAGWELLEEWTRLGTRVIVLSRFQSSEVIKRAFDAGATDVIGKPFAPDDFAARVAARLKHAPPQLQAESLPPSEQIDYENQNLSDIAEEPAVAPPAFTESRLTLGEQLRIARKQRNISLVQANLETRIQMYYIQALEEDRYGLLPRGREADEIVKTYAKFLGQDPQATLAEFRSVHTDDDPGPRDLSGQPLKRPRRWPMALLLMFVALLACAAVSTILYFVFPEEISNAWTNGRSLFADPTATATATVAPSPTLEPTPTVELEATSEPTQTSIPTRTLPPPTLEPSPEASETPTP